MAATGLRMAAGATDESVEHAITNVNAEASNKAARLTEPRLATDMRLPITDLTEMDVDVAMARAMDQRSVRRRFRAPPLREPVDRWS